MPPKKGKGISLDGHLVVYVQGIPKEEFNYFLKVNKEYGKNKVISGKFDSSLPLYEFFSDLDIYS